MYFAESFVFLVDFETVTKELFKQPSKSDSEQEVARLTSDDLIESPSNPTVIKMGCVFSETSNSEYYSEILLLLKTSLFSFSIFNIK